MFFGTLIKKACAVIKPYILAICKIAELPEDVAEYSGQIQTVSEAPNGVQINYYLGDIKLNSNNITLSTSGNYTITAKIENDTIYNDTQVSYTFTLNIINYQKWEFLS